MSKRSADPAGGHFRLLSSHERLLLALGRYEHLTAEQTRRLLFGPGSLTYVQAKYKDLADRGYVLRVPLGRPVPSGSGPLVYSLDRRGRAHLVTQGIDVPRRLRQSEERSRSSPLLRHSVAVVDVLILHELLLRGDARFAVARMLGERQLKGRPIAVALPGGGKQGVAVDAWVDLRIAQQGGVEQACLAYEVDNGTEWQVAWRRKVRALLAYEAGPYRAAFGVDSLTIVVVSQTGERTAQLLSWTEQEIVEQGALANADLWRFGAMPRDPADAVSFFRTPRWAVPGQDALTPLIEVNER